MPKKKFYVYIVTNAKNNLLYTGVTNNIQQRIVEHYTKRESGSAFTSNNCFYLLFYESFDYINNAITREKEIKGWDRKKKLELIKSFNPEFKFLNKELFGEWPPKELTSRNY